MIEWPDEAVTAVPDEGASAAVPDEADAPEHGEDATKAPEPEPAPEPRHGLTVELALH